MSDRRFAPAGQASPSVADVAAETARLEAIQAEQARLAAVIASARAEELGNDTIQRVYTFAGAFVTGAALGSVVARLFTRRGGGVAL